jgi:hypothetical protein
MRTRRFETHLRDLLTASGNPAIKDVRTFSEVGYTELPYGLQVSFVTGASILLQIVRTSPPGGDNSEQAEKIVEGSPLPPVEEPPFAVSDDRIDVKSFETWLAARITNSGSPEIQAVGSFHGKSHRFGIDITFYNGGHAYTYFPFTLRPGQQRGAHPIYEAKDFV